MTTIIRPPTARTTWHGRKLSAALGYEVSGRSVHRDVRAAADELRRLVDEHHVVFIRNARLDHDDFAALADRFGTRSVHPLHRLVGRTDTIATIVDDEHRPPAGFAWHSDLTWLAEPPRYGFLQALEIPVYGGDTMWASLAAVHAALPSDVKDRIRDRSAIHRIDDSFAATVAANHGPEVAARLRHDHPPVARPLVVRDPGGTERVTASPLYQDGIVGLDPDQSDRLLGAIDAAIADPHVSIRWRWSEGDVAIWDERRTVHRALVDHHPQKRRMRRCTVD